MRWWMLSSRWTSLLWEREQELFTNASRVLLSQLVTSGRIVLGEELFIRIYPELAGRLSPKRGWWNPLLSPCSVFHLFEQAVVLASAPQYFHTCPCYEKIYEAQGSLPSLQRLTEPVKVILSNLLHVSDEDTSNLYNTKEVARLLMKRSGDEDSARDLATRLSDLAAMGYRALAKRMFLCLTCSELNSSIFFPPLGMKLSA